MNMIKYITLWFGLSVLVLSNAGCVFHSTNSTEIGIRTKKVGLFGKSGVEEKVYAPGSTYFFMPIMNDWHTFDTKLQNIEMTYTATKGDILGRDDLLFKTVDGNDISLDLIVSYRIIPEKGPDILQYVAQNDRELRNKIVRVITRSRPRDIFGELRTEEFYNADFRSQKAESAKKTLNTILNPLGVVIERILTKDYRFNDAYQKAIEDKKIADQKTEQYRSGINAKIEEYKRKLEEAGGEVNKMVAAADGSYEQAKIEADAYYQQQQKIAAAIKAEGRAEAKGIQKLNQALAGSGGNKMVKLKIAEALMEKRIILLPTSSGLDLKTTDINKLLNVYGAQSLGKSVKMSTQPEAVKSNQKP